MKKGLKSTISLLIILLMMSTIITACNSGDSKASQDAKAPQEPKASEAPANTEKPKITFRMNISYSGKLYDSLMNEIAEKVSKYSDGRIQAQIVAAGTMGNEKELIEALQLNTLDMAYISDGTIEGLVKGVGWMSLPFMFDSIEEADAIYNYGWMRDILNEKMLEIDIVPISVLDNGFSQFASAKAPVESLKDFEGQKVRVPQVKALLEFYNACGALPVAIPGSEVLSALEQGTIDGVNNTLFNYKQNGYIDAFKYITLTNHAYGACTISVSKGFWDSLSEEDKAIVKKATEEACASYTKAIRDGEKEVRKEYEAKGMVFIEPSDELKEEFKVVRDKLWDTLGADADPAVMERIRKELGN